MGTILKRRKKLAELGGDEEYWTELMKRLDSESGEAISRLIEVDSNYLRNYHELASRILLLDPKDGIGLKITGRTYERYSNVPVAGIDSSSTPALRVGMAYFIIASSACVVFPRGLHDEPFKRLTVSPYHAPEGSDYENSLQELKLDMFFEELEALKVSYNELSKLEVKDTNTNGKGFVVLDGPIIDPPIFKPRNTKLEEKYKSYIRKRANLINRLLNLGHCVVGVIKRIRGNHLVSNVFASNAGNNNIGDYLNDFTFVNLFLRKIASNLLLEGNEDYDVALSTKPMELSSTRSDYSMYLDSLREHCESNKLRSAFRVFHFYTLPSIKDFRKRILGIEVAVPASCKELESEKYLDKAYILELAHDASKFLGVWTLPGQRYPLPVILAHNACTIKKRTARKILKELLSRFIRDTLILNRNFDKFSYLVQNIDSIIE